MTNEEFQTLVLQHFQKVYEKLDSVDKRQIKLENVVTRIETDHGEKLSILLDGHEQKTQILDRHTEQLDRIESKIESHDIQISVLDKTKANKRKAK
ncbi:hypothetical protein SAMN05660649_04317 [Desulfotomaculum arcticum]|uniref:Uncharacterized protein n=1 Tax=Desulfotruncus arcticus DSM 17038 TaxID=1121424 RepID=A0A1I2YB30_9FIRM|nr:hypothetical protein [Desulfotruncus arcticus]SFH22166.1 hypothetical protein SAMN05660649_04317 [Desulfotomaculum arcticum] [Desulfotruncus arcticus DSM 17038]